jgi:hypothetical protein
VGAGADAARRELVGETILLVAKEAISRTGAASCFVTMGLHASWRPATVFGSDLSMGSAAIARANALFECVSQARLVLKVCALPRGSRIAELTAERVNYKLCPPLWDVLNTRLGPLKWDLMASDVNAQALAGGGGVLPITHDGQRGAPRERTFFAILDHETRVVCQPRLRHDATIPQPGARPESSPRVVLVAPAGWDGSVPGGTWCPLLMEFATDRVLLAIRGTPGVFVQQTMAPGGWEPAGPVPWDVWGVRFDCA